MVLGGRPPGRVGRRRISHSRPLSFDDRGLEYFSARRRAIVRPSWGVSSFSTVALVGSNPYADAPRRPSFVQRTPDRRSAAPRGGKPSAPSGQRSSGAGSGQRAFVRDRSVRLVGRAVVRATGRSSGRHVGSSGRSTARSGRGSLQRQSGQPASRSAPAGRPGATANPRRGRARRPRVRRRSARRPPARTRPSGGPRPTMPVVTAVHRRPRAVGPPVAGRRAPPVRSRRSATRSPRRRRRRPPVRGRRP